MGVKEQDDAVDSLGKPLQNRCKVITCRKRRVSSGAPGAGLSCLRLGLELLSLGSFSFLYCTLMDCTAPEGRVIRPPISVPTMVVPSPSGTWHKEALNK